MLLASVRKRRRKVDRVKTAQQAATAWDQSTATGTQAWVDGLNNSTKPIVAAAIAQRAGEGEGGMFGAPPTPTIASGAPPLKASPPAR